MAGRAAKKTNNGTASSFNNLGNGTQSHTGTKINSGAYSGKGNSHHTSNNLDSRTISNTGTFNGHGNGGFVSGNFDASTRNHGKGTQRRTGTTAKTDSGANSGGGNGHHTPNNNNAGSAIYNSGTFDGHGNGSFIGRDFDASSGHQFEFYLLCRMIY